MQKLFLGIALVLGISNGQYLLNNIAEVSSDFYDLDIDFSADIGYQTLYTAGATTTTVTESYGFEFYSLLTLNVAQNFFDAYSNQLTFYFYPFVVDPFTTTLTFSRFDNG